MTINTFQIKSYLSYWLDAVDEHSLHSPFFFDFHTSLLKSKPDSLPKAEMLRQKLLTDRRTISVNDFGARKNESPVRKVALIAKNSLSTVKYASLYRNIISKYNFSSIIELGTSFGINSLYLAARESSQLVTFEGADEVSAIAELTFQFAEAKNIRLIKGNIDLTLSDYVQSIRKCDFAFMDAHHTYNATLKYFNLLMKRVHEKSIVVIDDIYYSEDMKRAWSTLKSNERVYGSIDLFKCGILFFDPSLNKQHVILQF